VRSSDALNPPCELDTVLDTCHTTKCAPSSCTHARSLHTRWWLPYILMLACATLLPPLPSPPLPPRRCLKFLSSSAMLPLPDARPFEAPAEVLGSLSPGALSRLVDHLVLCSTSSSAAVQQEGRKVARHFTGGGFRWALVDDYSLTKPHGPGGWWMNMP
jgi:hypothetical protein